MLLAVEDMTISFATRRGSFQAARNLTFHLAAGESLGVVGESGCGKSVMGLALMGLLPDSASLAARRIEFDGRDLLALSERAWENMRGKDVSMIFQDPMSALNPCFTLGFQIEEVFEAHEPGTSKKERRERSLALLDQVGIPDPGARIDSFPHELSGGMCQRAMIAMAIACKPRLLIADEPTTALDVTIQNQIMDLLMSLQESHRMAMILISHDLGVVAQNADRIQVMYAGETVETAATERVLHDPAHPYARGLLDSLPGAPGARFQERLPSIPGMVPDLRGRPGGCQFHPRCAHARTEPRDCASDAPALGETGDGRLARCHYPLTRSPRADAPAGGGGGPVSAAGKGAQAPSVIAAEGLKKHYGIRQAFWKRARTVKALDGVRFEVGERMTLGVVGESGCGKSTLARQLVGLEKPTAGRVAIGGEDVASIPRSRLRSKIQLIFQDPHGSLNPRKKAWQLIAEPLAINTGLSARERFLRAVGLMDKVGLRRELAHRYPHMFSGGQRQRIGVARALALKPRILVCDEPVSALDVSIQAQVLNLLIDLQRQLGLTYILISHDLHVVRHVSDLVMVMYLGKVVEHGTRERIFSEPLHPYTRALMASSPDIHASRKSGRGTAIQGELPSPLNPPSGCAFHKRCPLATPRCAREVPPLRTVRGREAACFEI